MQAVNGFYYTNHNNGFLTKMEMNAWAYYEFSHQVKIQKIIFVARNIGFGTAESNKKGFLVKIGSDPPSTNGNFSDFQLFDFIDEPMPTASFVVFEAAVPMIGKYLAFVSEELQFLIIPSIHVIGEKV